MKNAVLSLGMGVESCAILIRWAYEPARRPCPIEHLTVITAMVGDEFLDTARDMTNYILPLMRDHRIRYVQVARRGPKEADGITILSDTRSPGIPFTSRVITNFLTNWPRPAWCLRIPALTPVR